MGVRCEQKEKSLTLLRNFGEREPSCGKSMSSSSKGKVEGRRVIVYVCTRGSFYV